MHVGQEQLESKIKCIYIQSIMCTKMIVGQHIKENSIKDDKKQSNQEETTICEKKKNK